MLLHLPGAELGEAQGDATLDGLGPIEDRVWANVEYLVAAWLAPGGGALPRELVLLSCLFVWSASIPECVHTKNK